MCLKLANRGAQRARKRLLRQLGATLLTADFVITGETEESITVSAYAENCLVDLEVDAFGNPVSAVYWGEFSPLSRLGGEVQECGTVEVHTSRANALVVHGVELRMECGRWALVG